MGNAIIYGDEICFDSSLHMNVALGSKVLVLMISRLLKRSVHWSL